MGLSETAAERLNALCVCKDDFNFRAFTGPCLPEKRAINILIILLIVILVFGGGGGYYGYGRWGTGGGAGVGLGPLGLLRGEQSKTDTCRKQL